MRLGKAQERRDAVYLEKSTQNWYINKNKNILGEHCVMKHILRRAWSDIVDPILHGSKRQQVAALCYRKIDHGVQILLITSRDTGRWILPKGWPMKGKTNAQAALQEAWEEAGVKEAVVTHTSIGSFDYVKRRRKAANFLVEAEVFVTEVKALSPLYPEADERQRAWFSPEEAIALVEEPELKDLLSDFSTEFTPQDAS